VQPVGHDEVVGKDKSFDLIEFGLGGDLCFDSARLHQGDGAQQ
jgi:hypothetical protein